MHELCMNFSRTLNFVLTATLLSHATLPRAIIVLYTHTHTHAHSLTLLMCGPRWDESHSCHLVVIHHTEIVPKALILIEKLREALDKIILLLLKKIY